MDVAVVGAGIAGLLAADDLRDRGASVVVLEKARVPGGRMASRGVGEARFDHGAQFFTTKDDRFADLVAGWQEQGLAEVWFEGSPDPGGGDDGYPRFRAAPHMRAICEYLAGGLDVRLDSRVTRITPDATGWTIASGDGARVHSRALLCTPPVPQTLDLLDGVGLPDDLVGALRKVDYQPAIAVLATLPAPVDLGNQGALRLGSEPIDWIADNQAKGVSTVPAVTIHAGPELSRRHAGDPDGAVPALLTAAEGLLGDRPTAVFVHRWRFSKPIGEVGRPSLSTAVPAPLAVAGDGLLGGRVEGAALSGLAGAGALADLL